MKISESKEFQSSPVDSHYSIVEVRCLTFFFLYSVRATLWKTLGIYSCISSITLPSPHHHNRHYLNNLNNISMPCTLTYSPLKDSLPMQNPYPVFLVFVWSHSLEDPWYLFTGIIVNHPKHAGWNGAVELGYNQHWLLDKQDIPEKNK